MFNIRSLVEALRSRGQRSIADSLISRFRDVSLHRAHRRSGDRSSRKPRRRAAGTRPSRGLQQQSLQLSADLLEFPTHLYSILLHVLPLDLDIDENFDFHFYVV